MFIFYPKDECSHHWDYILKLFFSPSWDEYFTRYCLLEEFNVLNKNAFFFHLLSQFFHFSNNSDFKKVLTIKDS